MSPEHSEKEVNESGLDRQGGNYVHACGSGNTEKKSNFVCCKIISSINFESLLRRLYMGGATINGRFSDSLSVC